MQAYVELFLFTISLLPVIIIGAYVYKKDKNKEPAKLLIKLSLGGILSTILVLIISFILGLLFPTLNAETENLNFIELIFYVFIGIALVEEFCKWIMVYKISYNNKEFDHVYDMIVYSVFVALGFAGLENLIYVYNYGIGTAITRFLLAVPGHACDGVFMGYYLGLAKLFDINGNNVLATKYKILSLLVPVILHGIYDFCLYSNNFIFILGFFIFVILLYIFSIKKVNQFADVASSFINKYCPNCGTMLDSKFCPNCGRENK